MGTVHVRMVKLERSSFVVHFVHKLVNVRWWMVGCTVDMSVSMMIIVLCRWLIITTILFEWAIDSSRKHWSKRSSSHNKRWHVPLHWKLLDKHWMEKVNNFVHWLRWRMATIRPIVKNWNIIWMVSIYWWYFNQFWFFFKFDLIVAAQLNDNNMKWSVTIVRRLIRDGQYRIRLMRCDKRRQMMMTRSNWSIKKCVYFLRRIFIATFLIWVSEPSIANKRNGNVIESFIIIVT